MTDDEHILEDDFRTPDRVRHEVVEIIVTQGLRRVEDLQARGEGSEKPRGTILGDEVVRSMSSLSSYEGTLSITKEPHGRNSRLTISRVRTTAGTLSAERLSRRRPLMQRVLCGAAARLRTAITR